ncbi:UDP-glucose 4-epimerase-like protein [Desulfosarcina ovata subsp. sediminis]|uniref:UDP-glucose 4-epimerase-like protein n=1 Tax=Desulfosarcina ovata subsp. sediminis TaxID=885957 RepID=A0A5K7ZJS9_9BACT|nr:SDR family oxidoreductase [Desulfosarcina ovata]BBO81634.1 UDP-glucose 4-epimerase-like protein [Desulfosarcina ovata subsp. sediminis]
MTTIQRALVTGGAGFIGSHLAEALMKQGSRVTVLDNLSTGHRHNIAHLGDGVEFVEGDIRDAGLLNRLAEGYDVVFHQAAVVSVTLSVQDPSHSCEVNDLGTVRVLDACRRNGVGRVVMASSSAVYGDDPQLPKAESMPPRPMSPYAVQKLTGEFYAAAFGGLYGLETVCLRYFNVYGPRQDPSSPYSGVISIFMTKAVAGQAPTIYGDGSQSRDFVSVRDVVQANLLAATQTAAAGRVFNVGTGHFIRIHDLWTIIGELAHTNLEPVFAPPRAGDIRESVSDIGEISSALGFRPRVELRQGLADTLDWYRSNLSLE